jgi:hypothetical protein
MKDMPKFRFGMVPVKRKKLRKISSFKNEESKIMKNSPTKTVNANDKKSSKDSTRKAKIKKTRDEEEESVPSKANPLQDLDDIFGTMKPKEKALPPSQSSISNSNSNSSEMAMLDQSYGLVQSQGGGAGSIISPNPAVHRFDQATGLPVYKYTALLVGDGGGTALCPFDCRCCF